MVVSFVTKGRGFQVGGIWCEFGPHKHVFALKQVVKNKGSTLNISREIES
jgi:hypothetical protein